MMGLDSGPWAAKQVSYHWTTFLPCPYFLEEKEGQGHRLKLFATPYTMFYKFTWKTI